MRHLFVFFVAALLGGAPVARGNSIDWDALCKRGTAKVVVELTVGGGEEESEEEPPFLKPSDIAVASDGSFYVLDGDGYVVHFGRGGEELNRFAREGEGPGELRSPFGIEVDVKGRVVVYDYGNHRFSFFQPDGTYIETRPHQDHVSQFACTTDGRIVLIAQPMAMPTPGAKQLSLLVSCDEHLDHAAAIDSLRATQFQTIAGKSSATMYTPPFYTQMGFCVFSDGSVAYGSNDRYELHVVGPDLRPEYVIRRDIPPPPITDEDREAYFSGFESSGPEFVAMLRRDVEWPKHKACFDDLFTDGAFLIVVRFGAKKSPPQLDVFRRDRFMGTIAVPEFRSPRAVRGGRLFRTARGSDRLPSVVKYRIE